MDMGEDKMEKGARREGKSSWEIAEFYTQAFKDDIGKLNIIEPDIWCKATDNIPEQIELVKTLEVKGFTYQTSDGVYFDTSKFLGYNKS
jgi:cysteinyl-tRNA synthetase